MGAFHTLDEKKFANILVFTACFWLLGNYTPVNVRTWFATFIITIINTSWTLDIRLFCLISSFVATIGVKFKSPRWSIAPIHIILSTVFIQKLVVVKLAAEEPVQIWKWVRMIWVVVGTMIFITYWKETVGESLKSKMTSVHIELK